MVFFVTFLCKPGINCTVARHNPAKMLIQITSFGFGRILDRRSHASVMVFWVTLPPQTPAHNPKKLPRDME